MRDRRWSHLHLYPLNSQVCSEEGLGGFPAALSPPPLSTEATNTLSWLSSLPCFTFPVSDCFLWVISQMNYLHPNPWFKVCFFRNQIKSGSNFVLLFSVFISMWTITVPHAIYWKPICSWPIVPRLLHSKCLFWAFWGDNYSIPLIYLSSPATILSTSIY